MTVFVLEDFGCRLRNRCPASKTDLCGCRNRKPIYLAHFDPGSTTLTYCLAECEQFPTREAAEKFYLDAIAAGAFTTTLSVVRKTVRSPY